MCKTLEKTAIHHIEIDVSQTKEYPIGTWVRKSYTQRIFYMGANLTTSHISNDTLYIKALNDNISSYPHLIPELRSTTIITKDGVIHKTIDNY
ncbi:MAG: hypothetical protein WCZ43_02420 [Proteiniphilum sp.]